ncbi:hypothetical protein ABIE33_005115 [Ensifer sp. 4252]
MCSKEGDKTYRLTVPANVPVEQYWSLTAYDRPTHALIRNMPRASRSSQVAELQKNADGSVEEIGKRQSASRPFGPVGFFHALPGHFHAAPRQRLPLPGEFLFGSKQVEARLQPRLG